MNTPKYTLLLPTYKAKFLAEALESIKNQTYKDFQVIVSDDCSPENIKSIFDKVVGDDSRFTYRCNTKNIGALNVVEHWNKCLEYAKGDYVICIGDDDKLLPCCLDEYNKLMKNFPGLCAYHAHTQIIDENSIVFEEQIKRPEYENVYSLIYHRWTDRNRQFIGDFCFNTTELKKHGGYYYLPLAWASDDITAVMMASINGIANTKIPCFQYRVNRYTISKSANSYLKLDAIKREKKWYEDFMLAHIDLNDPLREKTLEIFELHFKNKMNQYAVQAIERNCDGFIRFFINCSKYGFSYWHVLQMYRKYHRIQMTNLLNIIKFFSK